jgi:hypothetical protein
MFNKIESIEQVLATSNDIPTILDKINEADSVLAANIANIDSLYSAFSFINVLCYMNLTFFAQHFIVFIFTKRMNRFYIFPSILHLSDLLLFVSSILSIQWFTTSIQDGLYVEGLTEDTKRLRMISNFQINSSFKF